MNVIWNHHWLLLFLQDLIWVIREPNTFPLRLIGRFYNVPLTIFSLFFWLFYKLRCLVWKNKSFGIKIIMGGEFGSHFGQVLEHQVFSGDFISFGKMVNFHVCTHRLINWGLNYTDVPDDRSLVVCRLNKSILFK